jgi:hypothetical protein
MEIRTATLADVPAMMPVYDLGRAFMRRNGNESQWINGYPSRELIEQDAAQDRAFLCLEAGKIAAVFTFFVGEEPSYREIREGAWLNDAPYGVIHRLASAGVTGGVGRFVFDWCFRQCKNLRVDTHRDNMVMRRLLESSGFVFCGVITIEDGTERVAFQRAR